MKYIVYLLTFLFATGISAQKIKIDSLKGTWAIVGIKVKKKDSIGLYQTDPTVLTILKKNNMPYKMAPMDAPGLNIVYKLFYQQYVAFNKDYFGSGFVNDSTYKNEMKGSAGKFQLTDSLLTLNNMMIRLPDGQYSPSPLSQEYTVRMINGLLELKLKDVYMLFYFKRISDEVIFKH